MKQYIINYLGGDQPSTPEEGQQHFAEYQNWLKSLGDAVVKGMVPHKQVHTISPDKSVTAGSAIQLSGHTIIQAESIEHAISYAETCPFLKINGSLEVAELVEM